MTRYLGVRYEEATGNPFEAVDQARHGVLWWVVEEQAYVFGLAVHFNQLNLEVAAELLENGLEPLESVSVKHFSSIFRDEDQVGL
jgi:hypothetical protein